MSAQATRPRIAIIHGTPAAIAPAVGALASVFPEAEPWNILDDTLLPDADAQGGLTPALTSRMTRLIEHALAEGAAGVLLSCSMYGAVAQTMRASVPVLAPDEAAFAQVVSGGFRRVLVLASFASALDDAVARLRAVLRESGSATSVVGAVAEGAMAATKAGDREALGEALGAAVRSAAGAGGDGPAIDAVLLAQYSLAPAADALAAESGLPVLSGPAAAAEVLRASVLGADVAEASSVQVSSGVASGASPVLRLFSTLAVRKALDDAILERFTAETGIVVEASFDPTNVLLDRIAAGERPDVMIGVTGQLDPLGDQGIVDLATRTPIATVGVGIAAAPGIPVPDISTVDALVAALLGARSVAYSRTGASGVYFASLLHRLDIADEVNARATIVEKGFTALAVIDGRADLAVQQLSELVFVPEAVLVGPLPDAVQHRTEFAVVVGSPPSSPSRPPRVPSPAQAFIDHLTRPPAAASFHATGLQPPP